MFCVSPVNMFTCLPGIFLIMPYIWGKKQKAGFTCNNFKQKQRNVAWWSRIMLLLNEAEIGDAIRSFLLQIFLGVDFSFTLFISLVGNLLFFVAWLALLCSDLLPCKHSDGEVPDWLSTSLRIQQNHTRWRSRAEERSHKCWCEKLLQKRRWTAATESTRSRQ